MKHFFAYSNPVNGHDRVGSDMSQRTLRSYYLKTFQVILYFINKYK